MRIRIETDAQSVSRAMKSAAGRQITFALTNTVNDLAFDIKNDHKGYVNKVFDRPTRWTENALEVFKARRGQEKIESKAAMKSDAFKGTPPTKYLAAEAKGGGRRDKRSERLLRLKGLIPEGKQTLVMPAYQDRYGNIRGSLMTKILSYIRAFNEVGYNMNRNMTKTQRKAALRTMKQINKTPDRFFIKTLYNKYSGVTTPIGIFERKGRSEQPVILFIKKPTYTKRYDLTDLGDKVMRKRANQRWSKNYARALATMRSRRGRPKIQF